MDNVRHDEEWRQLHQRLRGIAKRRAALDAEEARCLREAHEMKLWRRLGYAHMNEYMERELGYSPQVGIERLRIAHALATLPQIEASLADGRLVYSAVRELTRVATADTEQAWLDRVRGKNLREIEAMLSGKKRGDRPDDPSNPDLTMRALRLELAPAAFALFRQVQSAMADEHGGHLDDSELIEILCRRALEGDGSVERPPYQIAITQCESCGRGWQNGAGREIDIARNDLERARCDAEMIGSLDADEPPRSRTAVTPRVRRQVLARDHHRCTVPGCRSARNLDLHHIEYQSLGGSHEIWNLTVICSAHHKCLHDGLLTIRGSAPHALDFVWRESPGEPVNPVHEPSLPPSFAGPNAVSGPPAERAPPPRALAPSAQALPDRGLVAKVRVCRPDPRDPAPVDANVVGAAPLEALVDRAALRDGLVDHPAPLEALVDRAVLRDGLVAHAAPLAPLEHRKNEQHMPMVELATYERPDNRPSPDDRRSMSMIDETARAALVTAGYRPREAKAAVESARPHVGAAATLEQVIREALRRCTFSRAGSVPIR